MRSLILALAAIAVAALVTACGGTSEDSAEAGSDGAKLTLVVATTKGKVKARVKLGVRAINITDATKWRPSGLAPGRYTWWVTATDLAGNAQSRIVKKAMVLTR